jgi:hypothetical protein
MASCVFHTKSKSAAQSISAKQTLAAQMLMVCLMKTTKSAFPLDSAMFKEKRARAASLTKCVLLIGVQPKVNATH